MSGGLPTRLQLLQVISAALKAEDMQGVAAAMQVLAVVSPADAELLQAVVYLTDGAS